MKKVTQSICFALLALLLCNCTAKFEEFNSNPYEPTELNPRLLFSQLITCMSSTEENPAQRNITFWAGPFGGMLTPSSSWSRSQHFYTYNVDDSWNKWSVNWYFESSTRTISPSNASPMRRDTTMHWPRLCGYISCRLSPPCRALSLIAKSRADSTA